MTLETLKAAIARAAQAVNTQALLRVAADDTLQTFPPRVWCPADLFE